MEKELELKLVEKYPRLFRDYNKSPRETLMCWGCECGNGWYKILAELFEQLSKYGDIVLVQVKEKFGTLRVYYMGGIDENHEEIEKLIDEAEGKSAITCEMCGGEGKLTGEGWLITLCNECSRRNKRQTLS